jgi:hypothetical protein
MKRLTASSDGVLPGLLTLVAYSPATSAEVQLQPYVGGTFEQTSNLFHEAAGKEPE